MSLSPVGTGSNDFTHTAHLALVQANSLHLPLASQSVQMVCTSPPYYALRDYGTATWEGGDPACSHRKGETVAHDPRSTLRGTTTTQNHSQESWGDTCRRCGAIRTDQQLGMEATPEAYVTALVCVFREVKRVLRDDGTLWLNLGDTYSTGSGGDSTASAKQLSNAGTLIAPRNAVRGVPAKNLLGLPWRVAFALQADGWILRSELIWHKYNGMPESVQDRPTRSHEQVFLLSKQARYVYNAPSAGRQPNMRSVWALATEPTPFTHFATMPTALVRRCILAGCPAGGVVLDPFVGSGTTLLVARELRRQSIGIDLSWRYLHTVARERLGLTALAAWEGHAKAAPITYDDLPLFGRAEA